MALESDMALVVVRLPEGRIRYAEMGEWTAFQLMGSLSADPRTAEEMSAAFRRYSNRSLWEFWLWKDATAFAKELEGMAVGRAWIGIDLESLRLLASSYFEIPDGVGIYIAEEKEDVPLATDCAKALRVFLNVPPNWLLILDAEWDDCRPAPRLFAEPPLVRSVLFGRALVEGVARLTLNAFSSRDSSLRESNDPASRFDPDLDTDPWSDEKSPWYKLTQQVHAEWLMTPHPELQGEIPRKFLHEASAWVDREMDYRQLQWSQDLKSPPPLDRSTHAYQFGPLGRWERITYFDLCRELIQTAWKILQDDINMSLGELADRLADRRQEWMAIETFETQGYTPAQVIERERQRIPLVSLPDSVDCDCPICQQMHVDGIPMFLMPDDYRLEFDHEFAFSNVADFEDWQIEEDPCCMDENEETPNSESSGEATSG